MAGPTPAEWLNACTIRAKFNKDTGKIEAEQDDWLNLLSAAKIAYGITDEDLANVSACAALGKEKRFRYDTGIANQRADADRRAKKQP